MINDNIKSIQKMLIKNNIGAYIIPTADYHASEYVCDYFKERAFISGFTGSAGTVLITKEHAYLFADGRYWIQAEKQIKGTVIELIKQGDIGAPTFDELLTNSLKLGESIGVNAKCISITEGKKYAEIARKNKGQLIDVDFVNEVWKDRPSLPHSKLWILDANKYAGETTASKIKRIKKVMRANHCTAHVITTLDDIAWILNLRADDIPSNPVFLSYLLIETNKANLYIDKNKLTPEVIEYLKANNVHIREYNKLEQKMERLSGKVLLDENKVNYSLYMHLSAKSINLPNPTILMKSIKNKTEIKNLKEAHIKDGVALTKFMYWLKTNVGKIKMTEVTVQDYLLELRKEQEGFIEPSFSTICAYGPNAAMMHYSASPDHPVELKKEGMLLVDSGGDYYEGTTDITRTFVLGPITPEEKHHFTLVLQSNLNLADATFLEGCTGLNLDILARGPIWDELIDYKCGTGHGISYLLNVHEAPNGFRWKVVPERNDNGVLVPGQVTSDEPGIYIEGKYGIRHEQDLLCIDKGTTEWGHFLGFEYLSLVPIDLDGINVDELTTKQKANLNAYHKLCYEKLSPFMTSEEKIWLKQYTRAI